MLRQPPDSQREPAKDPRSSAVFVLALYDPANGCNLGLTAALGGFHFSRRPLTNTLEIDCRHVFFIDRRRQFRGRRPMFDSLRFFAESIDTLLN